MSVIPSFPPNSSQFVKFLCPLFVSRKLFFYVLLTFGDYYRALLNYMLSLYKSLRFVKFFSAKLNDLLILFTLQIVKYIL